MEYFNKLYDLFEDLPRYKDVVKEHLPSSYTNPLEASRLSTTDEDLYPEVCLLLYLYVLLNFWSTEYFNWNPRGSGHRFLSQPNYVSLGSLLDL